MPENSTPHVAVVGLGRSGTALANRLDHAGLTVTTVDSADLVIEAGPEDADVKRARLATLRRRRRPGTPLVTVTLAHAAGDLITEADEDLVALRLLTADMAGAAEISHTPGTSPPTIERIETILRSAGVVTHRGPDRAGGSVPALLLGLLNQAAWMVHDGYTTAASLDRAMRLGCGWKHGPLQMLDGLGVDTARTVLRALYARLGSRFEPAPVLDRLIDEGALGRVAERGFHDYSVGIATRTAVEPNASPGCRTVVVGSGTMATGIAESLLRGGFSTTLLARSDNRAEEADEAVRFALQRTAEEEGFDETLSRWRATADRSVLGRADIVIEAVIEDPLVKRRLFGEFGRRCAPETVLATTTSSLPVGECTEPAGRPGHVLGLHFFNPAPAMPLVELVPTARTSEHTLARARAVIGHLGKKSVECSDRPGFIVNSLLFPYLNQALEMLDEEQATTTALDSAVKSMAGHPLGPTRLLDTVGTDVALTVQNRLHEDRPRRMPPPAALLHQLVEEGFLGRKSPGKGLRSYLSARGPALAA